MKYPRTYRVAPIGYNLGTWNLPTGVLAMGIFDPSAEKAEAFLEAAFPGLGWIVARSDMPGVKLLVAVADWDWLRNNKQELTPTAAAKIATEAKRMVERQFNCKCSVSVRNSAGTWGTHRWNWTQSIERHPHAEDS
ncbi:MAG TPA: hypothetical protein VLA05_04125 [Coriobacteriia bacterium]|nr:hypothetical protein [Coriobacteriia bacterium]